MPQIYVIYRPEDTRKKSLSIIDNLKKSYGKENVLAPDFDGHVDVYQIERDVQTSDFLLAVIGHYWADMIDETGENLLNSVYDPVHMAIYTAIQSRKRIVPILIDGASMPSARRLPQEIRPLIKQEPVKLDNNTPLSKSLNKGLKDIIKRESLIKMPSFSLANRLSSEPTQPEQRGLPMRSDRHLSMSSNQRRRRSQQSSFNIQQVAHQARLPLILGIFIIVVLMTLTMTTFTTVERRGTSFTVATTQIATAVQPTSTPTTMSRRDSTVTESAPQITIPTALKPITVDNAHQLTPITSDRVSLNTTDQFVFTQNQSLFIFASSDLQEIQLLDVETNNILNTINTKPYQPIVIALDSHETTLYVMMNNGEVMAWGIPSG